MIEITPAILKSCMPFAKVSDCNRYAVHLDMAMKKFEINSPARQAAFIAQLAHESGSLRYVEEIASGDAYDTRVDLGNTPEKDGDGRTWKGHGLIQITGRKNHELVAKYFGIPMDKIVEWLKSPFGAAMSAGWYWTIFKSLNTLADAGKFELITVKINGGKNGLADRILHWTRIKKIFNV